MSDQFLLSFLLINLVCQLHASNSEDIYRCNKVVSNINCQKLEQQYIDKQIEPSEEQQYAGLLSHLQNEELQRKNEAETLESTTSDPIKDVSEAQTTEKPFINSCKYVDFSDLMLTNSSESFQLKAELNYRLRIDESVFGPVELVEWRAGRHLVNQYDWSKSCVEQRIAVDTDGKSLIILDVSTRYEKTYFANAKMKNSSIMLFEIKISVKKELPPSAYTSEIVKWSCFAGVAVFVILLLIIAHLMHLRYMNQQLRERENRMERAQ